MEPPCSFADLFKTVSLPPSRVLPGREPRAARLATPSYVQCPPHFHLSKALHLLKQKWLQRFDLRLLICVTVAAFLASPSRIAAQEKPSIVRTPQLFEFHSNFWVNLHQVLLNEAWLRVRAGKPDRRLQSTPLLSAARMSKQEDADWNAAVNLYGAQFGTRQQLFDAQLVDINDALAGQPDDGVQLNPAGLPPEMVAVLQSAAVIYRQYWWPAHNESNKNWISSQEERVQDLGPKLASAMTRDLHQPWPTAPIRVDVCYYVAALGHALTTLGPPHTTFSSSEPSNQDLSGFELLFHEASHTFARTLTDTLSAEGRTQHKDVGDLWHSTLFYTSGVELRRLLPAPEQASFTPYGYRYGVYNGGNWPQYRRVLETGWQAYLDGKIDFTDAIHSMVAALP